MASNTTTERKKGILERLFKDLMTAERRALLGSLAFFLLIVLVGWTAINEPTRLGTFLEQYNGRSIERGAVLFRENCASCHGLNAEGVPGRGPSLSYESFWDGTRLADVGWAGSQEDFILLTVAAGRPVVHPNYGEAMPTWSQEYGGPMRPDQVRDVVAYVMNFGLDPVADETVFLPYSLTDDIVTEPEPSEEGAALMDAITVFALEGDPDHGEELFAGTANPENGAVLGCMGCHSLDGSVLVGPSMVGLEERVPYEDYEFPEDLADEEVTELYYYLVESIWYPNDYLSPGFENGGMPANFKETMSEQDLADVISYILEFNESN